MEDLSSIVRHIYEFAMSVLNPMIDHLLNHDGWVIAGVVVWGLTHVQLYLLGEKALGYVVTVVLAVMPALIFIVLLVGFIREVVNGHLWRTLMFAALALVSLIYFFLGGVKNGKVKTKDGKIATTNSEKIKILLKLEVFKSTPADTYRKMLLLLLGATFVLFIVASGLIAGWQLIDGSKLWGVGLAVGALVLAIACHKPKKPWNILEKSYAAVTKLSAEIDPLATTPSTKTGANTLN